MDNRQMLMKKIQMTGFAMGDTMLFLDTHPNDMKALEYFKMCQKQQMENMMEYTKMYGPIVAEMGMYDTKWTWVDGPWPWECQTEEMM